MRLCNRIGLTEISNMLHYSNACSIEKNRRYLVIKGGGGLAWLLRQGGVVGGVVDHRGISIVTGSTGEKRGGETVNT